MKYMLSGLVKKLVSLSSFSLLSGLVCFSSVAENYQQPQVSSLNPSFLTTSQQKMKSDQILLTQRYNQSQKVALIIGNSNYRHGTKLRNAVNDAKDMARTLKKLNFEVILLTNADLRSMDQALDKFYQKLNQGAVGLFYYAGHGVQVNGENYLIPVDADLTTESEVNYESLPLGKLLGGMRDIDNDVNIIILDACRDNPFARSWTRSSGSKGLAPIQNSATGSFIAYATGPGNVAQDGQGRNGTFTESLLKHLNNANATVEEIFKKVRVDVAQKTSNAQVPWTTSSLIGDFYFSSNYQPQSTTKTPAPREHNQSNPSRNNTNNTPATTPPANTDLAINNRSNSPYQDLTGQALTPRKISILRSFLAGHRLKEAICGSSQHQVTITLDDRYVACAEGNSTYPSGSFSLSFPGELK